MNRREGRARLRETARQLRSDDRRRAEILLDCSFAVNLAYAVLQAITGILARSIWAGTLAFYYLILSGIRFSLLRGRRRASTVVKWRRYRSSACVMLALNFALLGIHCITLYMEHVISYPGYLIYAMALYTFYAAITAVRNVVRFRAYRDPILSASKALSLSVAAISVYSLQSAMISAFGDSEAFRVTMSNCVGAGVFLLISSLSVYMIVRSTKALKKRK